MALEGTHLVSLSVPHCEATPIARSANGLLEVCPRRAPTLVGTGLTRREWLPFIPPLTGPGAGGEHGGRYAHRDTRAAYHGWNAGVATRRAHGRGEPAGY